MQCPKCHTESFAVVQIREITVDRCKTCGGIWFDKQELVPLLNEDRRKLSPLWGRTDPEELNSQRGTCPRDQIPLLRAYSTINRAVIVDTCPQCHGIWLDGGEFDALLKAANTR